jgi:hypothetical protein
LPSRVLLCARDGRIKPLPILIVKVH